MKIPIARAAGVLLGGGVIAYPTEGVFGLGCMPDDPLAVARLLSIKQRDVAKGLILIAAERRQLEAFIDGGAAGLPDPDPQAPTTWIVPASAGVPDWVRGRHTGLAVRLTTNPVARRLCLAVDSPLVSTSANIAGRPVARNRFVLRRRFGACVDYVVAGDCGPASGPSEIRELSTGEVLRARRP
ncbi:MAG: Sua5/YciO/YrdC/YwlC family protein [Woeseiaceae bacterium]